MGPLVVVVLTHRAPQQVERLVRRITDDPGTIAVVHHDPTGEPLPPFHSSQVLTVPDPIACRWGRPSLVEAQWRSLRWVAEAVPDFSWVLLVSGQDYPVRSMSSVARELEQSSHAAYLRHFLVGPESADDVVPWQDLTRHRYLRKRRLPFTYRSVAMPLQRRHPFRDGTGLFVGDMWFNLSADMVHAMLDDVALSERLLRYLRGSPIPDEAFITSMALNSGVGLTVANESKRFISWGERQMHPELITEIHLEEIARSDAFFTRKIDMELRPDLPDLLDQIALDRQS